MGDALQLQTARGIGSEGLGRLIELALGDPASDGFARGEERENDLLVRDRRSFGIDEGDVESP